MNRLARVFSLCFFTAIVSLPASAANRLANSDFAGSLNGWTNPSTTNVTVTWEAPGTARLSWTGGNASAVAFSLYQSIGVVEGQSYTFGGKVSVSGPFSADGGAVVVCFYNQSGGPVGTSCPSTSLNATDGFYDLPARTVSAPATAKTAKVFLAIGKISGFTARFDDIFFDGPASQEATAISFDPLSPRSSDPIRFSVTGSWASICTPQFSNGAATEIARSGNVITLTAVSNTQCPNCPIGIVPSPYAISTAGVLQLAAGTYTVRYRVLTCNTPGPDLATRTLIVTAGNTPSVTFSASPSSITSGDGSELSWNVQNASSVSIDNGIGTVPAIGTLTVNPASSVTYRLTATGTGGTSERTASISVAPRPEVLRAELRASRTSIRPGEPVTLTWSTTNASSVTLEDASANTLRTTSLGTVAPNGSTVVFPSTVPATIYLLRATKGGGSVTPEEPIIIRTDPPPTIGFFNATPSSSDGTAVVRLDWSSDGDTARIDPEVGVVQASGVALVTPAETTLYTLKVQGEGGETIQTREVIVAGKKPPDVETGGGAPGQPGTDDGTAANARFRAPAAVRIDGAGNLYVVDAGNHTIRKIDPSGNTETWAGQAGRPGKTNGFRTAAQFDFSGFNGGFFVDRDGSIYVNDDNGVRRVTPKGSVSDCPSSCGDLFFGGAVTDAAGNLYESDPGEHVVRKTPRGGARFVLAGSPGENGFRDRAGPAARFNEPGGIAVDRLGNVYVSDTRNNAIRKISPSGGVETIAGEQPGTQTAIAFPLPGPPVLSFDGGGGALVMGANGVLYVADTGSNTIKSVSPDGEVNTVAGSGASGKGNGSAGLARFNRPRGLAIDSAGRLVIADSGNDALRRIDVGAGPGNGLPMLGGRFSVAVRYRNQLANPVTTGYLLGRSLSSSTKAETALFSFGDPLVVELIVRLSDARPFRNNIDVFFGGVSDVEFTITVTDALSGKSQEYFKPPGQPLGGVDRQTFKADPGVSPLAPDALRGARVAPLLDSTLRLLNNRYEVRVRYRNQFANPVTTGYLLGQSIASSSTTETAIFTFNDPEVGEWMVRFSDARPFANRIDFFHGGLSDVEFTIEVKDTATGKTMEYAKPAFSFLGAVDRSSWTP